MIKIAEKGKASGNLGLGPLKKTRSYQNTGSIQIIIIFIIMFIVHLYLNSFPQEQPLKTDSVKLMPNGIPLEKSNLGVYFGKKRSGGEKQSKISCD